VCKRTGNLAQYSYRKAQNQDIVMLGETEEYEPLSRGAYFKAMLRDRLRKMEVKNPEELSIESKQTPQDPS